jgi:hypothetical protein
MNSRERTRYAMTGQVPDRVPVWCQLGMGHIIRHGTPDGEYPAKIDDLVAAECRLAKRYGFDGMVLNLTGTREGTRVGDFLRDWAEKPPRPDPSHDFATADPELWDQTLIECEPADFYPCHLAREILGPDFHIGGWLGDAFSCAIHWFPSIQEAMMAIAEDAERFEAIVRYYEPLIIHGANSLVRLGNVESIQISSPYAGSSFISLEAYEELVLPQLTRLAAAVQAESAFAYVHTCGFIGDRLELIAESGVNGIECMDPPPLGNVELEQAKRRVGDRVFLKGNLDPVNLLLRGTEEEFERAVMECLRVGMPGGGYILSSACSVPPAVLPSRMERLVELAERFGQYWGGHP